MEAVCRHAHPTSRPGRNSLPLGSKDECLGGRGCMHDLNIMVMELGKSEKRRDKICEREMLSQYAFSRPHPNHLLDVKTTLKQTQ